MSVTLQRYEYNNRYDKPVANPLENKTSSKSQDFSTMSNGEKLRKYLGSAHADKYGHPPEVPAKQHEKYVQELKNKLDNPPFLFNGPPDTAVGTETHQGDQNKGIEQHLTPNKEQMAAMRAWMEKVKANPDNPEVQRQGKQLLAEIKGEQSTEPEKSSEQDRRKLQSSCFQWGIPNEVTAIGFSDGVGTAISVTYNLNTINTCTDTISNVAFSATETITCPAGCVESLITNTPEISGLPSSIAQGQTSTGARYDTIACIQVDANGAQTPTVPTSMSTVVYPTGTQGDYSFLQGMPVSFNVYP
jgi:hypothetical protein